MVKPLMLAPPLIFAALAGLFIWGMGREDPDNLPSTRVGQAAPALELTALGALANFDNETLRQPGVKLVNFWASWCAPCRVEHPTLEALAAEGIPIYGVNFKDDPEKALAFLRDFGDPYAAVGADANGRNALEWGVYGVPETYVIDGGGKVLLRYAGPITQRTLKSTVRPVLDAAR